MNVFFFKVVKTNTKNERLEKPKKVKLLLLIPKTKHVSRIKYFRWINIFN